MDWNKMTDEQFAEARKAAPGTAIMYALGRLEQLQAAMSEETGVN